MLSSWWTTSLTEELAAEVDLFQGDFLSYSLIILAEGSKYLENWN